MRYGGTRLLRAFVGDDEYFVLYTILNKEPMESFRNRSDVVMEASVGESFGCSVVFAGA